MLIIMKNRLGRLRQLIPLSSPPVRISLKAEKKTWREAQFNLASSFQHRDTPVENKNSEEEQNKKGKFGNTSFRNCFNVWLNNDLLSTI